MAFEHVNSGPCTVLFNSAALGFSQDGAQISYDARWGDIFSDDWGGAGGAPADTQLLGLVGSVNVDLTKYDAAEVEKLASFIAGGDGKTLPPLGTFIRQDSKFASLVLDGTNKVYTFATAFPRQPQSLNAGTKFSTFNLHFEFWLDGPATSELAFQAIS
jgi:hypothetical protein